MKCCVAGEASYRRRSPKIVHPATPFLADRPFASQVRKKTWTSDRKGWDLRHILDSLPCQDGGRPFALPKKSKKRGFCIEPQMGNIWEVKKTEKAKAKTLAYIRNCLVIKSIFFLIPKTLQWLPDFTECHFCSVVLSIVLTFKEL